MKSILYYLLTGFACAGVAALLKNAKEKNKKKIDDRKERAERQNVNAEKDESDEK